MSARIRDWLPANGLDRPIVREQLARAVEAWSAEWFTTQRLAPRTFQPATGRPSAGQDTVWRARRADVAAAGSDRGVRRLCGWALDTKAGDEPVTDLDRRLMAAFEQRLLDDLLDKLEAALRLPPGQGQPAQHPLDDLGGLLVGIGDGHDQTLLTLAVSMRALLPLCRQSLPERAHGAAEMASPRLALTETPVHLTPVLGTASLLLADVRDLAVGDVLILDRPLAAPLDIVVSGTDNSVAQGHLAEADGRLTLSLQSN